MVWVSGSVRGGGCGSANEVVGDEGGVAAHAVDAVGVAGVLEVLAEDVQPGQRGDTSPLADLTESVEDGQVEPRIRAAVPGRPHHAGDAAVVQVEPMRNRSGPDGRERLGVEHFVGEAA